MKEARKPFVHKCYTENFRLKIIELVESGEYNISELNRIYEIGGVNTIRNWLRSHGKESLIGTRELIVKAEEVDQLKKIRAHTAKIESELRETTMKYLCTKYFSEELLKNMTADEKKSLYIRLSTEQLKQLKLMGIRYL